jgi:hypothetical protein
MKHLIMTSLILLQTAAPVSFAAPAKKAELKITNVGNWELKTLEDGSLAKQFLGDADFVVERKRKPKDIKDLGAQAKVFKRGAVNVKDLSDNTANWRKQVFGEYLSETKALVDRTMKNGNEIRYFAEYQVDEQTETMLNASLVAIVVDGQLYVMVYEQYSDYFSKNITSVRDMFKNVKLSLK